MNYIYNIHLNFNKMYFDFYEWNDNDEILHIKKIPIIRTNTSTFKAIISHKIKLNQKELENIEKKTEISNKVYKLNCLIMTDTKNVIALKFDQHGTKTMMSAFNLEDEYSILHNSNKLKETVINYKILNRNHYIFETRREIDQKEYLLKTISTLPFDTLKYIYYECFNKEENDHQTMKKNIIRQIEQNNFILNNQIYNILKPISTN